jgi:hypothetical protein
MLCIAPYQSTSASPKAHREMSCTWEAVARDTRVESQVTHIDAPSLALEPENNSLQAIASPYYHLPSRCFRVASTR